MPLRVERCSTDIRDFHNERNVVQRHSIPDEPSAVFRQRKVRVDAKSYLQNFTTLGQSARPINRSKPPKEDLCERWPLSTARPRRRRDFSVPSFAVQVVNRRRKAGCADPVSLSRTSSQTAENASPMIIFLATGMGCWPWDHPPGNQCPTLGPEGWFHPEACCQSYRGDFSWLDSA